MLFLVADFSGTWKIDFLLVSTKSTLFGDLLNPIRIFWDRAFFVSILEAKHSNYFVGEEVWSNRGPGSPDVCHWAEVRSGLDRLIVLSGPTRIDLICFWVAIF